MAGLPNFQFDPSIFTTPCDGVVTLNGPGVTAQNIQIDGYPRYEAEENFIYPVYFEVEGLQYHYVVSVWTDRAEIKVCQRGTYRHFSTISPRNQEELLEAIATIGADWEELDDWIHRRALVLGLKQSDFLLLH